MGFIKDNYVLIIIIGGFLIFAIIGYIIDMLRNTTPTETKSDTQEKVKTVEPNKVVNNNEVVNNDPDELLQPPEFKNKK